MGIGSRQHRVLRAIKRRGKVDEGLALIVQLQPGEVRQVVQELTKKGLLREEGAKTILTPEGLDEL